jgi:hypothetical protein
MGLDPLELMLRLRHFVIHFAKQFCLLLQLNVDVLSVVLEVLGDSRNFFQLLVIFFN